MNLVEYQNWGIETKTWVDGIWGYNQQHCQITLTDDGARIYRTPNLSFSSDGYVMWGGFVIDNSNNRYHFTKGHTYMIRFEVKGQTSNEVTSIYWTCQVGWGGGECEAHPSNVQITNPVTANYNSSEWKTFTYKWTINDDVYKACTSNYNNDSFIAGQSYVSYKGFKYGFDYMDTGALGTDIYIRNIRLYDITDEHNFEIKKTGVVETMSLIEDRGGKTSIYKCGEIKSNNFIEL